MRKPCARGFKAVFISMLPFHFFLIFKTILPRFFSVSPIYVLPVPDGPENKELVDAPCGSFDCLENEVLTALVIINSPIVVTIICIIFIINLFSINSKILSVSFFY